MICNSQRGIAHAAPFSTRGASNNWIQVPGTSLDDALQLRRHPAAVKVARLRYDLLAVDEAVPGPGVEGEEASDRLETGRRRLLSPYAIAHVFQPVEAQGKVRRHALPLAPRLASGFGERHLDRRRRQIVCYIPTTRVPESVVMWPAAELDAVLLSYNFSSPAPGTNISGRQKAEWPVRVHLLGGW